MNVTDVDRKEYYDKNKEKMLKNDDISLQYFKINISTINQEKVYQIKEILNQVKQETLQELQESLLNFPELKPYFQLVDISSQEAASYTRILGDIMDYAFELEPMEITDVILENDCFYLIQCISRKKHNFIPLEELTDHINKSIRQEHYE